MSRPWLRNFKGKHLSFLLAYLAKALVKLIVWTCRLKVQGLEQFIAIGTSRTSIVMLWHNRLTLCAEIVSQFAPQFMYAAFVSNSRDGDPLAIIAESYPCGTTIRVPYQRRHEALKKMIERLKAQKEVMLITPDGPRGPRYTVKPGVILAAQQTDAAVFPMSWSATRFWQFNTWDRLILPKPFATISIIFGSPVELSHSSRCLAEDTESLENALKDIDFKACASLFTNPQKWPQ
ncbi:MAG: hypothetical protein CK425_06240 [Parachlamydia sp.]|nr:MAG: hypothetical protein CK425_06240 [Parachlamydia sp.]